MCVLCYGLFLGVNGNPVFVANKPCGSGQFIFPLAGTHYHGVVESTLEPDIYLSLNPSSSATESGSGQIILHLRLYFLVFKMGNLFLQNSKFCLTHNRQLSNRSLP